MQIAGGGGGAITTHALRWCMQWHAVILYRSPVGALPPRCTATLPICLELACSLAPCCEPCLACVGVLACEAVMVG